MALVKPKLLTLVLVHEANRVLLGRKKRGFGEGYYNGFGGKVEKGETVIEAAARELHEESGLGATILQHRGILTFHFDDNRQPWEVHVYRVPGPDGYRGTPRETDEMAPDWYEVGPSGEGLPYQSMWADDVYWYPMFLQAKFFRGVFWFVDTHVLQRFELNEVASGEDLSTDPGVVGPWVLGEGESAAGEDAAAGGGKGCS